MDVRDGTHDTPKYVEKGYPLITSKDFKNGKFDFSKTKYISSTDYQNIIKRSKVEVGDILYSMIGGNIGSMIQIRQENYFDMAIKNVALFKSYPSKSINTEYVAFFLESKSKEYQSIAIGGAQPFVGLDVFRNTFVPLPPLIEQQRIVAEVERWFTLIDQIEQDKSDLQTIIRQTKNKILDLAIHGKLVPQDPDDEPAIELLKRINPDFTPCDNGQYEKLPYGWCICHIDNVASSLLGKTLDREKNTGELKDYICALNVQWGYFDLSTIKQFRLEDKDLNRYTVKRGDLLVCEGGDVGRAAIWDNDKEVCYQNALHRIRFFENISAKWFMYQFMYLKYKGTIDGVCKGVTIKHFTQNVLNSLCFYLPPLHEQYRIVAKIEELFTQLDKIEVTLQ